MSLKPITADTTDEELEEMADDYVARLEKSGLPTNRKRLLADMTRRRDWFRDNPKEEVG